MQYLGVEMIHGKKNVTPILSEKKVLDFLIFEEENMIHDFF